MALGITINTILKCLHEFSPKYTWNMLVFGLHNITTENC